MTGNGSTLLSGADLRVFEGGRRLELDSEPLLHVIESGSVALMSDVAVRGERAGAQRFLARLGPGQALLSVPRLRNEHRSFVALPARDSRLRTLRLDETWIAHRELESPLGGWLDGWIELLARLEGAEPPAGRTIQVAGERELALEEGDTLCPEHRSVLWVRVLAGDLECMDDADALLAAAAGPFPLGRGLWLRARGPARVRTCTSCTLDHPAELRSGLAHLHELAARRVAGRAELEERKERERLHARGHSQHVQVEAALAGLASVLGARITAPADENPLIEAMGLIARHLGVELRRPPASDDDLPNLEKIEAIARASHLRVRPVTLSGAWWRRDCGALLAFRADATHGPLALLPSGEHYELVHPRDGRKAKVRQFTAEELSPLAVQVYEPFPEGPLEVSGLLRFALARRGRDFALAIATGVAATLLGMLTPMATALLMDQAIPDADRGMLLQVGLALFFAAFGMALFGLSQRLVLQRMGLRAEADTQAALWDRLLRLRPAFFRRFSSGDLQARVTAVEEVGRAVGGNTIASLFAGVLALLNLILLFSFNAPLALLALGVALFVLVVTAGAGAFIQRHVARLVELEGSLFGFVVQLLDGIGKLRVAGAEQRAYVRWLHDYARQLALKARVNALTNGMAVFNQVVPLLGLACLYLLSQAQLQGGAMSLGTFLAFNTAYATFLAGVTSLSSTWVQFLDVRSRARRVRPILQEAPEVDLTQTDPGRLTGRIEVEALEFGYDAKGPPVLQRLNLDVEAGEFVALVGPSGSGKSTLIRLLLGFEAPPSGRIRYDGQDLATLDVLALRRQIGVVLQDGVPDAATIFENIASGRPISQDEAWAAAEDAGLAADLRQMPMGLHTLVSVGGANLSGGQRQRLLIARALAMRPRILLFDEATSALDNRTQEVVCESLERLRVTRLVIAHRMSTIRRADRIFVLENGHVVQVGTFEELARNRGRFAEMMSRQRA